MSICAAVLGGAAIGTVLGTASAGIFLLLDIISDT